MSKHAAPPSGRGVPRRRSASRGSTHRWSTRRLFAFYAAATLVPVLLLGAVLVLLLGSEGRARGMAEARAKADLLTRTAILPALLTPNAALGAQAAQDAKAGQGAQSAGPQQTVDLKQGVTVDQALALAQVLADSDIPRVRIRDLSGIVRFPSANAPKTIDADALEAADGETVSHLTRLNADAPVNGDLGPRVVEIYQPLTAGGRRIGVLEMYLPYDPIAADIRSGERMVLAALGAGLALLWLCLMGVSASVIATLRRQSEANAFLAAHDTLTRLPNRAEFTRRVRAVTARASMDPTAVALFNIDRFREVNDALGHDNGDRLIAVVADRLRAAVRPDDVIARLGGDEFGVILLDTDDESAGATIARLRTELSRPLDINDVPLTVEASVGYALTPSDDTDAESLLRKADIALMVSKRDSQGVARYHRTQDTYDASALILLAQLRAAIDDGQLLLHFQPKGDLHSRRISAVEALVRWQHPDRGLLYPDAFLPAVEQTELIDDLTRWLLATAGRTLSEQDPTGELSVAVNISARSLIRADFADEVIDIVGANGIDPRRIILEITETAIVADPPRATRTLNRLAAAGFRISVDDFGAGQTGLGQLTTLPLSELKIDKAFVMSMAADPRNAAIVRSVIELGHSLGVHVTAEGVETAEDLARLDALGCDTAQGYLLSRPVASASLPAAIQAATDLLGSHATVH